MATPESGYLPLTLKDVRGLTGEQFAAAAVHLTKTIPRSLELARRALVEGDAQATVARGSNVSPQQMSVIVANVRKAYLRSSQDAASLGWVTRPVSLPAELWAKVIELETRAARLLRQRSSVASKALRLQVDDQRLQAVVEREQTARLRKKKREEEQRKEMRNATQTHARLVELQKAERRTAGATARAQAQQAASRQRRVQDDEVRSAIDKATAQAALKSSTAKAKQKAAGKTARTAASGKPKKKAH